MGSLSRRRIVVGALAVPTAGTLLRRSSADSRDPLPEMAAAWIAHEAELDRMEAEWGNLESVLLDKARVAGIPTQGATRSRLPEARQLKALDHAIRVAIRQRDQMVEQIASTRAITPQGAIAKIDLGVRAQWPFDWRANVQDLLEGGLEDLRRYVS